MAQNNGTGWLFYLFLMILSSGGLIYFLIWSFQNQSLQGIGVAATFSIMIALSLGIVGYIRAYDKSKLAYLSKGSFSLQSLYWTIGLFLAFLIGALSPQQTQSVISLPKTAVFATLSSQLPAIIDWLMNQIVIPISEESFWLIALPPAVFLFMDSLGNKYSFFKNKAVQFAAVVIIGAATFAFFHVAKVTQLAFIISAVIFRTFIYYSVIGDDQFNVVRAGEVLLGFGIGYHIGNNIYQYGIASSIDLLIANPSVGFIVGGSFLVIFLAAMNAVGESISDTVGGSS